MASNTSLEALKSHLFATLEGLGNLNDKKADECEKVSIEQAKAIVGVANTIIDVYKVQVEAVSVVGKLDNHSGAQVMLEMGVMQKEEK